MDGVSEWAAMGGYAAYVWPAWGFAVAVLVGLLLATLRAVGRNEAALATLQSNLPDRARRRGDAAGRDAAQHSDPEHLDTGAVSVSTETAGSRISLGTQGDDGDDGQ